MYRKTIVLTVTVLFVFCFAPVILWAQAPSQGESFPDISLPSPETEAEKSYLGLSSAGPFLLSHIKTDVLIIEIFNMYCPYCQREAPRVNELYRMILKSPELGEKIKIIGIGAGNTDYEVNIFRKEYDIRFPLFSDELFSLHKTSGGVRTPYFFVLKFNKSGSNTVLYSRVGSIKNPEEFLDLIVREGLNQVPGGAE
jgi:peroxiredoxin